MANNFYNLESLNNIIRSSRVFTPEKAINNLNILKCGYIGTKSAVLNYLYQVSDIYEYLNNNVDISNVELNNLELRYKDVVNELITSITTSISNKLSDNSKMLSYGVHWLDDIEEQDSNIYNTQSLFRSQLVTFDNDNSTVTLNQSSNAVLLFDKVAATFDSTNRTITLDESNISAAASWPGVSGANVNDIFHLYNTSNEYITSLRVKSKTEDSNSSTFDDEVITFDFVNNDYTVSNLSDGDYTITNWGPISNIYPSYVYFLFDDNDTSQAFLYYKETTGNFSDGNQTVTFRIIKTTSEDTLGTGTYANSTDSSGDTIWDIREPTANLIKVKMQDLPILPYKAFDVSSSKTSAVTTYCDRPSMQIMVDKSTFSVLLRIITNSEWSATGINSSSKLGNSMFSRVSTSNPETTTYVLCPSTELRSRADVNDINTLIDGGIRDDGTIEPDVLDPFQTYKAFGTRANTVLFLESILTSEGTAPLTTNFDISENDIVYFLGFLDHRIRQTEIITNRIKDQINFST